MFVVGHATHPDCAGALALVVAQLEAQMGTLLADEGAQEPTLGLVYLTDAYASEADVLHAALTARWPGVAFVGTVGVGVCASGVEYFDEPGLVVMLMSVPRRQFQVFSGKVSLGSAAGQVPAAATALVHADPTTHELADLLGELCERTTEGYLFGGVCASRGRHVQLANGVFSGGLSGVAFSGAMPVVSRVTQGCAPIGPARRVTACDGSVVLALDGQPALPVLLGDLQLPLRAGVPIDPRALREVVPRLRRTLVGLTEPAAGGARSRPGSFGDEVRVRHLVGVDPGRQGFAVADVVHEGMQLSFCERDAAAARRDLLRMCTEVRAELESRAESRPPEDAARPTGRPRAGTAKAPPEADPADPADATHAGAAVGAAAVALGAVYVSCSGRGGPHFGGPSAELELVRHALGDIPLVGFFAAGEIAHRHLYGYTGVLTVFCRP